MHFGDTTIFGNTHIDTTFMDSPICVGDFGRGPVPRSSEAPVARAVKSVSTGRKRLPPGKRNVLCWEYVAHRACRFLLAMLCNPILRVSKKKTGEQKLQRFFSRLKISPWLLFWSKNLIIQQPSLHMTSMTCWEAKTVNTNSSSQAGSLFEVPKLILRPNLKWIWCSKLFRNN